VGQEKQQRDLGLHGEEEIGYTASAAEVSTYPIGSGSQHVSNRAPFAATLENLARNATASMFTVQEGAHFSTLLARSQPGHYTNGL
jgi:hypothetical protein